MHLQQSFGVLFWCVWRCCTYVCSSCRMRWRCVCGVHTCTASSSAAAKFIHVRDGYACAPGWHCMRSVVPQSCTWHLCCGW